MRRTSRQLLPVAVVIAAILVAVALFLLRPEPEQVAIERRPLLIDVAEVVKQDIRVEVRSQGAVVPRTETLLAAEIAGKVVEVADNFEAGGFFRRGELLLRIDERNYLAEVARAEAAVASAESELAQEQGRSSVAESDWIRAGRPKRSAASQALALRQPQQAEARARLEAARADLAFAHDQLERTVVRAPYDGMLRSKAVGLGQYVSVGTTLAEMFAIDYAEVRLPLPMARLDYLDLPDTAGSVPGTGDRLASDTANPTVQLYSETGDGLQSWSGRLVRTEGVIDEQRRVLFAVAAVDDPYGLNQQLIQPLRIGTFVTAVIEGRLIEDLVALPRSVLRAGNRLWIIDTEDRLRSRSVDVLRTDGDMIYVRDGLDAGERVSLSSLSGAVDGTRISTNHIVRTDQLRAEEPAPAAERAAPLPLALPGDASGRGAMLAKPST